MASNAGAYALKDEYDREVLSYIEGQVPAAQIYDASGAPGDLGFDATDNRTPLQIINRLDRIMNALNVPTENRWLVAGPYFWEVMGDEENKFMHMNITGGGQTPMKNGQVSEGLIHGFKCFRSNNITGAQSAGSVAQLVLAGHMSSTATASQIAKIEKIRDPFSFADVVRGLHMYGRKTLRTEALAASYFTID